MRYRRLLAAVLFLGVLLGMGAYLYLTIQPLPSNGRRTDCSTFRLGSRDEFFKFGGEEEGVAINRRIAGHRNLGDYEELALDGSAQNHNEDGTYAEARSFLWQQWQARRRTYLRLTLSTVDATTTTHLFIEPDEVGRWHIVGKLVRHYDAVYDIPSMYAVRWARPPYEWNGRLTPLSDGQQPDPARDMLELRGVCGTEHLL